MIILVILLVCSVIVVQSTFSHIFLQYFILYTLRFNVGILNTSVLAVLELLSLSIFERLFAHMFNLVYKYSASEYTYIPLLFSFFFFPVVVPHVFPPIYCSCLHRHRINYKNLKVCDNFTPSFIFIAERLRCLYVMKFSKTY